MPSRHQMSDGLMADVMLIITTNSGLGFSKEHSQFGFDVSSAAGQTLVIQASTNLSDWMPLQTNLLDSALWYFTDRSERLRLVSRAGNMKPWRHSVLAR